MKYYFGVVLLCIGIVYFSVEQNKDQHQVRNVIRADGAGYYAWLPALIIYHDANFDFCDSTFKEHPEFAPGYFNSIVVPVSGGQKMNKYGPGCAISGIPFFLIAHVYGKSMKQTKGFERHYQYAWMLSSLLFICLGMYFLFAIGKLFHKPWYVPFVLSFAVVFGSNLYHYATFDVSYSHSFTFGWVAASFYFLLKFKILQRNKDLFWAAICLAMIVLVRQFNLVLLPIVVLTVNSVSEWFRSLNQKPYKYIKALLVFLSLFSVTLVANYWQTGQLWVYSYGQESFNFKQPHFVEFLFGFNNGAFVYTPVFLLIIMLSTLLLWQNKRRLEALLLPLSFLSIAWTLSCWSSWRFGCTLGNRPLIDWYVLFAVPIVVYFPIQLSKTKAVVLSLVLSCFVYYNQVLHFQYRNWILNWCDMNYQKFSDVFLKTDMKYAFYTTDGWDFNYTTDNKVIQWAQLTDSVVSLKNNPDAITILYIDSLKLNPQHKYRLLFTCEAKYHDHRGENMMRVNVMQGTEYHDMHRKFFKKDVRKLDTWTPFKMELYVPHTDSLVNFTFIVQDNNDADLEIRNMRYEWISYRLD